MNNWYQKSKGNQRGCWWKAFKHTQYIKMTLSFSICQYFWDLTRFCKTRITPLHSTCIPWIQDFESNKKKTSKNPLCSFPNISAWMGGTRLLGSFRQTTCSTFISKLGKRGTFKPSMAEMVPVAAATNWLLLLWFPSGYTCHQIHVFKMCKTACYSQCSFDRLLS